MWCFGKPQDYPRAQRFAGTHKTQESWCWQLRFTKGKGSRLKSIEKSAWKEIQVKPGTSCQISPPSWVAGGYTLLASNCVWQHMWRAAKQGRSPESWCQACFNLTAFEGGLSVVGYCETKIMRGWTIVVDMERRVLLETIQIQNLWD